MIGNVFPAGQREALLETVSQARSRTELCEALRRYVLARLHLPPETREDDLYRLVVLSVKLRMPGVNAAWLEERLATTDCHQTSYVVSRKTLMMMEIEKGLGVRLPCEALDRVPTLGDYAKALWEAGSHES